MIIRDILLTAFVFGSLPIAFARPYVGALLFTWVSMMNPHRLTWGFAFEMPFAQILAVTTLAGLVFTKDRRPVPMVRESVLLVALWAVFIVSTFFAQHPEEAAEYLSKASKILIMVFVVVMLVQDRKRVRWLLLIVALSVGFYGVKGGIWGLAGGHGNVLGPPRSFFGDNNGLALALNMTLPLLWFLAEDEPRRWARWGLRATFGLSIVAILLTYSRGGLVALVVVLAGLWWRVKAGTKIALLTAALVCAFFFSGFLPERWFARMETIQTYEQDTSALRRLDAWRIGWRMAIDNPLLGAGFQAFSPESYARYRSEFPPGNAHSIYFLVLGEHGFTGIVLYVGLMASTLLSLNTLRRRAARGEIDSWFGTYARPLQVSLAGFAVGGAFLSLSYFDYYFLLVGITIVLKRLAQDATAAEHLRAVSSMPPVRAPRIPPRLIRHT